jgi:hypothetical protein
MTNVKDNEFLIGFLNSDSSKNLYYINLDPINLVVLDEKYIEVLKDNILYPYTISIF